MNKKSAMMSLVLLPMMSMAQSVTSPNGNVEVKFSLTGNGQPTYEMSYKGKTVCKPSHLGLELVKDKHASKGKDETDLMDGFSETGSKTSSFDETWKPVWGETAPISLLPNATSPSVSVYMTTAWAYVTSFHSRTNSTTLS